MANDAVVIQLVSQYLYQAILATHLQHPEWVNQKYRHYAWHSGEFQAKFTTKIVAQLESTENLDALERKLLQILRNVLAPSFFVSPEFVALIGKVHQATHAPPESNEREAGVAGRERVLGEAILRTPAEAIAILLLDAENLQLDADTEQFLASVCTYPIQIKVAFANWRSMGKKDAEFHSRGYELIHVPAGKDSADVKMATVGSSIFVHYPTAREVLVCSSDKVMSHLCNTLQTHGLTVYRVHKRGEKLVVFNSKTGETNSLSLKPLAELSSLEQLRYQLKELIKFEQERSRNLWLKLSKISQVFQEKYNITINQAISTHSPGKKVRDVFLENPSDFVVHQLSDRSDIYINLFEPSFSDRGNQQEHAPISHLPAQIRSQEDLEQALLKITQNLTARAPEHYIPLTTLGSQFKRQYGQPVTVVIKQLKFSGNFIKFLQARQAFDVKQTDKGWQVRLPNARSSKQK
jgi:hypothetical protein